jgi:hypothetical protein
MSRHSRGLCTSAAIDNPGQVLPAECHALQVLAIPQRQLPSPPLRRGVGGLRGSAGRDPKSRTMDGIRMSVSACAAFSPDGTRWQGAATVGSRTMRPSEPRRAVPRTPAPTCPAPVTSSGLPTKQRHCSLRTSRQAPQTEDHRASPRSQSVARPCLPHYAW